MKLLPMRKRFTPIFLWFMALALTLAITPAFGQGGISKQEKKDLKLQTQVMAIPMPVNFNQQLDLQRFTTLHHITMKSKTNTNIEIDTAVVYSNYSSPTRYTYLFNSSTYRLRVKTEIGGAGQWQNNTLDTLVYDSVGNVLSSTWKNWSNNQWGNFSRSLSTYGQNHTLLTQKGQIWQNGQWVNSDSSSYVYNQHYQAVSYYYQVWQNNQWVNNTFQLFVYDNSQRLTSSNLEIWNDSTWLNKTQYNYTYDKDGNVDTALYKKGYLQEWVNYYEESYTYDASGNMLSYLGTTWNDTTNAWVNDQKYSYTYNASGYLETGVGEDWVNNAWVNTQEGNYTYGDYGGLQTQLIKTWKSGAWADTTLISLIYDNYGDAIKGDFYIRNGDSWAQNHDGVLPIAYNYSSNKEYFTGYHVDAVYNKRGLTTGVSSIQDPNVKLFTCFPNPVNDASVIRFVTLEKTNAKLIIYNMNGLKVKTLFSGNLPGGDHSFSLNINGFQDGIYVAVLYTDHYSRSLKLIIRN